MKIAIMQPYFLAYIGYFQLIQEADIFVVYDNIKYTKKGWINRNRILQNGTDAMFTLSLKKASDFLDVRERELSDTFSRDKLLNQLQGAYARAPYFKQTFPLIEQIVRYEDDNLFGFIFNSIVQICQYLGIQTEIKISSAIDINHDLTSQDKVIAICEALGADKYVNPIGGLELYSKQEFKNHNIELSFLKSTPFEYTQYDNEFVAWLSIIDVMMFNSIEQVKSYLNTNYELI